MKCHAAIKYNNQIERIKVTENRRPITIAWKLTYILTHGVQVFIDCKIMIRWYDSYRFLQPL